MEFRILGLLEVVEDGHSLALAAGKQRALLAILLLRANEVVSSDELIDGLWGEHPPATAAKSIQIYVSQLRKALGDSRTPESDSAVLVTRGHGYELQIGDGELDLRRFEQLRDEGREALAADQPAVAAAKLREGLSLWRGQPLADFTYEPFAQPEIARLEEARLNALEDRIDADLALGRHADLIGELEALVARHPLRERLRGQLMLALYRSGRQAEALDVYQQTRRLLHDELGLEPSPSLQELEKGILNQHPALATPVPEALPRPDRTRSLRRPRTLILVGLVLLLAAIAAGIFELTRASGSRGLSSIAPNSVGEIDPTTNRLVASVGVGTQPAAIDYGHGALWVSNQVDGTISRVDPKAHRQTRAIPLGANPSGVAAGKKSIWVATNKGVKLIDPAFNEPSRTLPIFGRKPTGGYPFASSPTEIAFTNTTAWISTSTGGLAGAVVRADSRTGRRLDTITVGDSPVSIAAGASDVWVADPLSNTVSHIDSTGALVGVTPVGHAPTGLAVGSGAVWVADSDDDDVKRIDPKTGSVVTTIRVGRHPAGIAVGAGGVWVANQYDGTVWRIDPDSNNVVAKIEVGSSPVDLAVSPGFIWVTAQANSLASSENPGNGGVLRIDGRPILDPAQSNFDGDGIQMQYATCAFLLNYPDKRGPDGARLRPEVARSMPTVSPDGKTYTFTLRTDYQFSPPSNEPVTANTFKYTIERVLDPTAKTPLGLSGYMDDMVGVSAYQKGKARHIRGVIARRNRLTIKLTKPDGDFPARTRYFCSVPTNTPVDTKNMPIPSAGPYYVASATPEGLVLRRNPNYKGPRPRHPSEIIYDRTGAPGQAVDRVIRGKRDYVYGNFPDPVKLEHRYGSKQTAGRDRFFVSPFAEIDAFALNTRRPLFSDPRLRRAVNYAIDRRALTQQGGYFSTERSIPTDQYLPRVLRGFKDVSIYPQTPDLPRARQLAGRTHRRAVLYTCNLTYVPCLQDAQIIKKSLGKIGINVEIRAVPGAELGKPGAAYDLALVTWAVDYPDPWDVLNYLLDGNLARRGKGLNLGHFDDPTFNLRLEAANRLSGEGRYRAYGRLDADLARDAAPLLIFANETRRDFFSARVGCQLYQPVIGMDLGALCIRG